MKITLAQIAPKLNRSNLERAVAIIKEVQGSSDLIIFPELSLSGYMLQDKLYEDAWELEELEVLAELSKEIDIVVGAALRDKKVFRNAALYFKDGVLHSKHYKLHLPNYGMFEEARYFEAGDAFESFVVEEKRLSMLVCEDLWNANMHSEIYKQDPDLIIVIAASPARGFGEDGLLIEKQWKSLLNAAALNSKSKVVFVNRVGFEDGLGFWGGSCIIDEQTSLLAVMPKYKEIIETFEVEI
ncbi:MAG: nitrilase [Epsilonproteobacteria bacterium]|nr:nitrilase [Campylobacterota bacterium]